MTFSCTDIYTAVEAFIALIGKDIKHPGTFPNQRERLAARQHIDDNTVDAIVTAMRADPGRPLYDLIRASKTFTSISDTNVAALCFAIENEDAEIDLRLSKFFVTLRFELETAADSVSEDSDEVVTASSEAGASESEDEVMSESEDEVMSDVEDEGPPTAEDISDVLTNLKAKYADASTIMDIFRIAAPKRTDLTSLDLIPLGMYKVLPEVSGVLHNVKCRTRDVTVEGEDKETVTSSPCPNSLMEKLVAVAKLADCKLTTFDTVATALMSEICVKSRDGKTIFAVQRVDDHRQELATFVFIQLIGPNAQWKDATAVFLNKEAANALRALYQAVGQTSVVCAPTGKMGTGVNNPDDRVRNIPLFMPNSQSGVVPPCSYFGGGPVVPSNSVSAAAAGSRFPVIVNAYSATTRQTCMVPLADLPADKHQCDCSLVVFHIQVASFVVGGKNVNYVIWEQACECRGRTAGWGPFPRPPCPWTRSRPSRASARS